MPPLRLRAALAIARARVIVSVNVRTILYGAAALALTILTSPDGIRSALAASASALVEVTPFLFASAALARILKRRRNVAEYFGCGCGAGPSARSLPATALTWLLFGPHVALMRFGAASIVARILSRRATRCRRDPDDELRPLGELADVVPAALFAGAATQLGAFFDPAHLTAIENALCGVLLGFVAAPCGLGAVTVAGALHERSPAAAVGFLCVAGLVDVHALRAPSRGSAGADVLANLMLCAALGIVALRHGDALVHPAFAVPVAICGIAAACLTLFERRQRCATVRVAPAIMLAGALLGAPPPRYHATETTMQDLFAGERLSFTGALVRGSGTGALVRYAITCCRADATPIAVRLDRPPAYETGTWLRVDGVMEDRSGEMQLKTGRIQRVDAPNDPFLYW